MINKYKDLAELYHQAELDADNTKLINKLHDEIQEEASRLKADGRLEELKVLLNDDCEGVRLWSATHLLDISEIEAVQTLTDLEKHGQPEVSFSAKMVIMGWKSGNTNFFPADS